MKAVFQRTLRLFAGYGAGYARVNQLGLRLLGLVYFIAFASYAVQADGLVGTRGVLPFAEWLAQIRPMVEQAGYHHVPTVLWLAPTDAMLHACLWAGLLLAALLMAGLLPLPSLIGLWVLYLSVVTVGRVFWGFQWDNLLLEAGLLGILAAPWRWRMRWCAPDAPPRVAIFLFHWLVFRLMFLSGYVKLASRDEAWWNLTALTYHYWTQPLPIWTAWFANLLPLWFQKFSCLVMFAIELACPFLIWFGARARAFAAAAFIVLMALIAGTGNYTFFNLLTAVLSLWLIRDSIWREALSFAAARLPRLRMPAVARAPAPEGRFRRFARHGWILAPAVVIFIVSIGFFMATLRVPVSWPDWVGRLAQATAPFRSINSYGLFAVMTKTRPEIVIEGSWDGQRWVPYEFRWKPGDISLRPRLVAPHQPRLDWQMWFAALGNRQGNPWLIHLMIRLLQGEQAVLDLLAYNPFEQRPPVVVRAVRYEYRFSTRAERREFGVWWMREFKDLYCPPIQFNQSP